MPRRARNGRFVRGGRRAGTRTVRRTRYSRMRTRARSYYSKARTKIGGFGRGIRRLTHGAPNTVLGRPVSRMVAPTLAIGAELTLVTKPLSNGDSWVGRINNALPAVQQGNWGALLGQDNAGNNVFSIAALQIQQNAPDAVVLALESVALGAFGRFLGA